MEGKLEQSNVNEGDSETFGRSSGVADPDQFTFQKMIRNSRSQRMLTFTLEMRWFIIV